MRTTLTLDPDVAAQLKAEVRRRRKPFKELVNEYLRKGLNAPAPKRGTFRVKARPLNPRPGFDFDNIGALLEQIEGPLHK